MKTKDIKIGEMYNVRVKVVKNDFGDTGEIATVTIDENGKEIDGEIAYYTEADAASFSPITPENGSKNSNPAPKYDPCRRFKKGDKVRVVEYKGRCKKSHCIRVGDILSIAADEANDDTFIARCERNNTDFYLDPAYLELVTTVEELEPYSVVPRQEIDEPDNYLPYYAVVACGCEVARFYVEQYIAGQAKAAAEAECARLNAEHRKEQSHD